MFADDHFYHNMAYHSQLCEEVAQTRKSSPVLFAIHESAGKMKLCGLYHCHELINLILTGGTPVILCFGLLWILTPSFLIPLVNNTYESYSTMRFNQRCSPYRHKKEDDYEPFNYPKSDDMYSNRVKYV